MLKVVSRSSRLATVQVHEVMDDLPDVRFEHLPADTFGDRHPEVSLITNTKADIFTDEIDRMVLDGTVDFAIHSAKDLPYPVNAGLQIVALTRALDKSDSLVSAGGVLLHDLPLAARIGTSSAARKEQVLKIRPDAKIVSIRGNIEERIALVDSKKVDAIVVATCALQRLNLLQRVSQKLPFSTHPLQGHLAVVSHRERDDLSVLFHTIDIRRKYGKVWLVGFGPGDPDLMTIKADKTVSTADVILYDDLIDAGGLKRYTAEKIYVGKRKGKHYATQKDINELMFSLAVRGKETVRLKGGDPLIFARGGEEIQFLQKLLIDVEVIPGITAAQACAASQMIPLTMRTKSSSLSISSAHSSVDTFDIHKAIIPADTKVFYMGASRLSELAAGLKASGVDPQTPVALVRQVSYHDEYSISTTVGSMAQFCIESPVTIIVGAVVEQRINSKRILFTGLAYRRFNIVGRIIHYPLIKTHPILTEMPAIHQYDAIVFSSKQAVQYFFTSNDSEINGIRIFAIGRWTGEEIKGYGYRVENFPVSADSDYLAETVRTCGCKRVLYPCSKQSNNALHTLSNVYPIAIYETLQRNQPPVDLSQFSGIIFSSASTVDSFLNIYGKIPPGKILYVYGKHTKRQLIQCGVRSDMILSIQPSG